MNTRLVFLLLIFFVGVSGQRRRSNIDWRNQNGWCEEARTKSIELAETCYADDQCCAQSSQCANGCCGKDKYCHEECYDGKGEKTIETDTTLEEYKAFLGRPKCARLVYNRKDEDLEVAVLVFRVTSFVLWIVFMTIGICCCCRARNQDFKERAEIKLAIKKMSEKIRSMQSEGGEMMGLH